MDLTLFNFLIILDVSSLLKDKEKKVLKKVEYYLENDLSNLPINQIAPSRIIARCKLASVSVIHTTPEFTKYFSHFSLLLHSFTFSSIFPPPFLHLSSIFLPTSSSLLHFSLFFPVSFSIFFIHFSFISFLSRSTFFLNSF